MTTQNGRTALKLGAVAACMVGLAFAAVPLYDLFCRVTGFGGTPATADAASGTVLDETIVVRFDASTAQGMPWEFEPEQVEMEIRIGETGLAFYRATNNTARPIAGTATYNVAPFSAGGYFTKIDCFCFTEQVLQPGESVRMPVTFYVDPEILEDREARHVQRVTLSYTFFETELPEETTDLTATEGAGSDIN